MAVKLEHSDLAQHRAGIGQQLRQFWTDHQFCDVVLKSRDGTKHPAHRAVLSAASVYFKILLGGSFQEAERVRQKEVVEIDASEAALSAVLDYIYDGQPEVPAEVGLELLGLADRWDLPKFAGAIEAGILASLDHSVALQVLQKGHGFHSLRSACEDKVAEDFETCSKHPDFGKLSARQLARILRREDLGISREEDVVNAIFAWNKKSEEGHTFLGMLLQHVHFPSLSIENLLHLGRTSLSGPSGDELHRDVETALASRKRSQSPGTFRSKRRRFQHFSPSLGASINSTQASAREVLPFLALSLCWYQGELFAADREGRILGWKPGDPSTCIRRVAGEGAAVTGINDLGCECNLSILPSGEMFVSDCKNRRLLRFQNGSGDVVVGNTDADILFCSPNGMLYVLSGSQETRKVQKVVGSRLETVIASENLPEDMQFEACGICVTKEEVIYISDNFEGNRRILCINPAVSLEPVVVGELDLEGYHYMSDLFVTDGGTIYVAVGDEAGGVFAFHPSSPTFTKVVQFPDGCEPVALLVHDRSLYVSTLQRVGVGGPLGEPVTGRVYKYLLPPELQLE